MTDIDQAQQDSAGEENVFLEAIRALQHEGTRAEVAEGFRETGNELAREKKWSDAREFYGKSLATIRDVEEGKWEESVDVEGDKRRIRDTEEKVLVNRALCNLEMRNYRSCILDCAATLKLNPQNVKAYYRSARALLALDKIPEAQDAADRGLALDPTNRSLLLTTQQISARKAILDALAAKKLAETERAQRIKLTLTTALRARGIKVRETKQPPDLEDATMHLSPDPLSPTSTLVLPCVLLYPMHAQSDFIKQFDETQCLRDHLEYIFPLPWDNEGEYDVDTVDCFMETINGGLIRVGKKVSLLGVLNESGGKVEIVDGLVKINVVPVGKSRKWIEEVKARRTPG
ncbi:TPR-domain-containing protein [Uncinocarpus reesii 1704]|uniref:TPR-domain-containing protein n=1 Tax=Uncinocarpus reesii (strain UAMH 1704) TaxID=336963 RepID=C4JNL3_UNCRE|nr:TPR-domain-containing protein [Uncinocarpus reesii 1704]EEP78166.1 TPR-domain-containing protein [Uncinocarpus reesii 1704]